tara:strand:- start:11942 stop:12208 length:267 start_codon:yes stop_codon:yes gene_type:complete
LRSVFGGEGAAENHFDGFGTLAATGFEEYGLVRATQKYGVLGKKEVSDVLLNVNFSFEDHDNSNFALPAVRGKYHRSRSEGQVPGSPY